MHIGLNGVRLIHHFEGRTPFAYNDPVGHCTAGPGILLHRGRCTPADYASFGTRSNPKISDTAYEAMFRKAIGPRERQLEEIIGRRRMKTTKRHEFSAMLSLGYNIGMGALASSSVVRLHKQRQGWLAGAAFMLWVRADGRVLPGLVRRRKAERWLYRKGEYKVDF